MNHSDSFILVGRQDIESIKKSQQDILNKLEELHKREKTSPVLNSPYVTPIEFMLAVRIRRRKFNCLVSSGKIMSIKKKRKINIPKGEIERYFSDVKDLYYSHLLEIKPN
jgi:hypothetical protein